MQKFQVVWRWKSYVMVVLRGRHPYVRVKLMPVEFSLGKAKGTWGFFDTCQDCAPGSFTPAGSYGIFIFFILAHTVCALELFVFMCVDVGADEQCIGSCAFFIPNMMQVFQKKYDINIGG